MSEITLKHFLDMIASHKIPDDAKLYIYDEMEEDDVRAVYYDKENKALIFSVFPDYGVDTDYKENLEELR